MSNIFAVPGSVSLLQTNTCTGGEEDAILIEGTADRCVSLRMNHRGGGKLLTNGRAQFGGQSAILGFVAKKNYL